ncbi:KIR protein [Plasmodium coatneyi]|uniref:KIR protein n=1 Tax=Plasmodium coatneyi TaxID=208452 RepID=A0A1B1E1R0_9APIC|nr:KIR protein [Plasmodium coatneyi]ANQ08954.1 KIR protein [Plasmodium coatneyi]
MSGSPLDADRLPAHVYFYGPFEDSNPHCCQKNTEPDNIQTKLASCCNNEITDIITQIEKALCFVSGMKPYKEYPLHKQRWNFLYYWIGDKIWNALKSYEDKSSQFAGCLEDVCKIIKTKCESDNGGVGEECKLTCHNIEHSTFTNRKKFFDFTQNYNNIKDYLHSGREKCETHWSTYKQGVTEACTKVKEYCDGKGKDSNDPYCTDIYKDDESYCTGAMLPKLECKSQDAEIEEESTCSFDDLNIKALEENVRNATTTASIYSIIGTLGLTVVPYALYKYKRWSSWFGNHSSGNGRSGRNRRKGRSTGHEFDTLTDVSAVDSTIADSTEVSTIYDRSPKRGTRSGIGAGTGTNANNNSTSDHHQRTNFK